MRKKKLVRKSVIDKEASMFEMIRLCPAVRDWPFKYVPIFNVKPVTLVESKKARIEMCQ